MSLCVCVWGGGGGGGWGGKGGSLAGAAKHMFATTKLCLPRQNFCRVKIMFVMTNICRNKHVLVTTKVSLSWQSVCSNKIMFVATNICRDKSFVPTKICVGKKWGQGVFFYYGRVGGGGGEPVVRNSGTDLYIIQTSPSISCDRRSSRTCIFGHMGPSEKHQKPAVWKTCSFCPRAKLGPHFQRSKH